MKSKSLKKVLTEFGLSERETKEARKRSREIINVYRIPELPENFYKNYRFLEDDYSKKMFD